MLCSVAVTDVNKFQVWIPNQVQLVLTFNSDFTRMVLLFYSFYHSTILLSQSLNFYR